MSWSPKRESNRLKVSYDMNRLWYVWSVVAKTCPCVPCIQDVVRGWQRKRGGVGVKENDEGIPSLTTFGRAKPAGPDPVPVSAPIIPSNK